MFKWLTGDKPIMEVLMRDPSATETIIWQHPSTEFNINSRVNLGLNEVAVFYDMYSGNYEILNKSTDLKTNNIPVLSRIPTAITGGVSKYQCRVYFIRTAISENLLWGTPKPLGPFYDGIHKGMTYSLVMNGIYTFQVADINKLLQFVDSDKSIDFTSFEENRVLGILTSQIYKLVTKVIQTMNLDFILSREFILNCSDALKSSLQTDVLDNMGMRICNFEINDVSLPDDPDDPYKRALASMTEESAMVQGLGIQGIQNYILTHGVRVAELSAANSGAGGAMTGIGIGAGVGAGIGGQLGNMINSVMSSVQPQTMPAASFGSQPSNISGMSPSSNPVNPQSSQSAPIDQDRLIKLKQLFDLGIITQSQYDQKVSEILKSI